RPLLLHSLPTRRSSDLDSCSHELDELDRFKRPHDRDEKGIVRFATRLHNQLGPVWIPRDSRVADLIIEAEHKKILHGGKRFTKADRKSTRLNSSHVSSS